MDKKCLIKWKILTKFIESTDGNKFDLDFLSI